MNNKSKEFFYKNHFYIFVGSNGFGNRPDFHIVTSTKVSTYISESHSNWLKGKKRDGSARKDTSMRKFNDFENKFKETWQLLKL